jgi:hypothetical protein
VLHFVGEAPRFCGFCGRSLPPPGPTLPVQVATVPPTIDPCATVAPAPGAGSDVQVPEVVGGYRLLRRLGGGGMGSVYEAQDVRSGRRVALKLVLPEYAEAPGAVERFRQEGRLASSLSHPRCVFVLAADEDAGRPYIVMELMPGRTLDDLVREQGPLPPDEAITRILDVIDGLREAHHLGLVHRDVKPSNCFLETNGRVKVGDFGLARSLASDSRLTRTGTFLGTPLYAAPEQIKMEAVDAQADVYSVAATLYFLLAGRAPFESGDALATLARIVSEGPPPLRGIRPELSPALERVVLRGLQRERGRRWRDLDEFRAALLPLLPVKASIGGVGLRFAAYVIDQFLLGVVVGLPYGLLRGGPQDEVDPVGSCIVAPLVNLIYFSVLEGCWGWSVGKRLLRLRVGSATDVQPPGLGRALLRIGILYGLANLGTLANGVVVVATNLPPTQRGLVTSLLFLLNLVGWGLLLGTMGERNGYRGLHEILSGTRTYRIRPPSASRQRLAQRHDFRPETTQPEGMPQQVGPFQVSGALRWEARQRALVGADSRLGRAVWLWLRPASEPALDAAQRDVSRGTRVRWVDGGKDGDWQWDAFVAPTGVPLPALVGGGRRLSWTETRPILEDLADELAASCADGTLPCALTAHQVLVRPGGGMQLLGPPLLGDRLEIGGPQPGEPSAANEQERALAFLAEVAALALEGEARPAGDSAPVRALVPPWIAQALNRLLGVRAAGAEKPYETVEQLRQDLEAKSYRATEVTRLRRGGHLALMFVLLHLPFPGPSLLLVVSFMALALGEHKTNATAIVYPLAGFCTAFWVVWAFVFRGGYGFWRGGIVLRRADGGKVSRWQCAYRALLVWAPVTGLLCLANGVAQLWPDLAWLYFGIWGLGVSLLPVWAGLALWSPTQGPHDRLAGTYLVPSNFAPLDLVLLYLAVCAFSLIFALCFLLPIL